MIEPIKHNGCTIEIHADKEPQSPREWDNLGKILCFHSRYNLGDKNEYDKSKYSSWNEFKKAIEKDFRPVIIFPIYMMDHSGLSISTDTEFFRGCDPQGWDWGIIGFAFVSREDALREYGAKIVSKKVKEKSEKVLRCEVETWGHYVSGEVYGYTINDENGEEVDSCWGNFGYNNTLKEAKLATKR